MRFFFCGDIVISGSYESICDTSMRDKISSCDYAVCNFEAPIVTELKATKIKKVGPHIKQSANAVDLCANAGFNIFSLANNHIYDYGHEGVKNTISKIINSGSDFIGIDFDFESIYKERIFEKDLVKVGLISAAESEFGSNDGSNYGYAYINSPEIDERVKEVSKLVDCLIVFSHAGVEKVDLPLPEWRERYRQLCNKGADYVIGHHPHVPQGYEKYNNSTIFYSLGNFFFDTAGYGDEDSHSFSIIIDINKDESKVETVFHCQKRSKTQLVSEAVSDVNLDSLNKKLVLDYEVSVSKMVASLFVERYLPYYKYSLLGLPEPFNIISFGKVVLKWLFRKKSTKTHRDLLLYHNINIDSHRYVVQRYLKDKHGI